MPGVGVEVGVLVGVRVGVGVLVGVGVHVCVAVLVGVGVPVGVLVGVAVLEGVLVGVAVLVGVLVGIAVLVGVLVGVAVLVSVLVGVAVLVGVLVGVGVHVGVGSQTFHEYGSKLDVSPYSGWNIPSRLVSSHPSIAPSLSLSGSSSFRRPSLSKSSYPVKCLYSPSLKNIYSRRSFLSGTRS